MPNAERLRELVALNRFITSTLDYQELLERVVEKTAAFTGADACVFLLLGRDGIARVAASRGLDDERVRGFAAPLDERIGSELMRLLGFGERNEDGFLGVPVIDQGIIRGLLAVYRDERPISEEEETFLVTALADQAAIALGHASRFGELRAEKERHFRLLRAIQSNTSTYLVYLDPQLRLVEANAGFCRALGVTCQAILGRPWDEVQGAPEIRPSLEEALLTGRTVEIQAELTSRAASPAASGERRFWNLCVRPVPDLQGRPEGLVVSATDVTAEVLARQEVERANRRKDEFLAMLGHELRNPVAAIATAAEVMRLAEPSAPLEIEVRDVVHRQVRHLARLLDDLLDVSRITRGTIELKKTALDLRDIVTTALESSHERIRARRQRLEVRLPEQPVGLYGDPDRLVQALANLLTNANRYTPEGGSIEIAVETSASAIELSVKDDGEGISAEDMPFLFEPFLQSKRGLDRPGGGLGLGLTLVKQLVELHGGSVEATSQGPGRGSKFTILLPRVPPKPTEPDGAERVSGAARRVLIVEDNLDFAQSLATLLAGDGHQVEVAPDGRRALELVAGSRPDVVLLDIGLPQMDGFELARRIRESERPAPLIVAISGYGHEEDRRRAREAGIDHYLVKPFWHERLRQLLAGFC